jgi:DNA-binding beta-propeller fold protein YncE
MKLLVFFISITIPVLILSQQLPFSFDAKAILALSDADMVASAYTDGFLHRDKMAQDAFSVIQMGKNRADVRVSKIYVPNSVNNWTKGLDKSSDGKFAFVAAAREATPDTATLFASQLNGKYLYAVDIQNFHQPVVADRVEIGTFPLAVQSNARGNLLATATNDRNKEITLVEWRGTHFGKIWHFAHGVSTKNYARVTDISWHPSGQFLAVTLEENQSGHIAFYKIHQQQDTFYISPIGNPLLHIGRLPGAGQFSPDGKFYFVPDLKDWVSPGALLTIGFSEQGQHRIVSTVQTGIAPEGFGIDPDGRLLAVANMNGTYFNIEHPLYQNHSNLQLFQIGTNGKLTLLDEQAFEGLLPENVVFDADGDMLAVAVFDYADLLERRGGVEFWRIVDKNGKPSLQKTGFKVSLTRGTHALTIVK